MAVKGPIGFSVLHSVSRPGRVFYLKIDQPGRETLCNWTPLVISLWFSQAVRNFRVVLSLHTDLLRSLHCGRHCNRPLCKVFSWLLAFDHFNTPLKVVLFSFIWRLTCKNKKKKSWLCFLKRGTRMSPREPGLSPWEQGWSFNHQVNHGERSVVKTPVLNHQ